MTTPAEESLPEPASGRRTPRWRSLPVLVLVGAAAGALTGAAFPSVGAALGPLADLFVRLLHLVVAPVVFCTLTLGIADLRDGRRVGRLGGGALVYFEAMSTLALILGLAAGLLVRPGEGLHIHAATLDPTLAREFAAKAQATGPEAFLLGIIPDTLVGALAQGGMLQVLFVSLLSGFALSRMGEKAAPMLRGLRHLQDLIFQLVTMVMRVAPLGAFGAMALVVGKYGVGVLVPFLWLAGAMYGTQALFVLGVCGAVARASGFSLLALLRLLKEELFVVLGTACSESALPGTMRRLEEAGLSKGVVSLVVPAGYSFNLDGTNIYMTLAILFIAQATDTALSTGQIVALLATAMLTTRGMPGIPGSVFIALAATFAIVPAVPAAGIALLLGVDRFLNTGRSLTNVIGNAVGAVVVARWDKGYNPARFAEVLGARRAT